MVQEGFIKKSGFALVHQNDTFKCAFITADRQYAPGQIRSMKRHNGSDEVFVLIQGKAVLVTGEPTQKQVEYTTLQTSVSYCVEAGQWHYLAVSEDAIVFVSENSDVSAANTDEIDVTDQLLIVEV